MTYVPKVNDFVRWSKGKVEGWIYFTDSEYITIEIKVTPKNCENYEACSLHRNDRLLILCYANQWKELEYVKTRESVYEEETDSIPLTC